jgi:hypothetical protein
MIARGFASLIAVIGSAALTLATVVALVRGTIATLYIDNLSLRIFAMMLDVIVGTALLLGCIFVATHLAVLILGVGNAEFPPLPHETTPAEPTKN